MSINRRDFLKRFGASIAAISLDPERLLWVPGQMVSVPAMPQAETTYDVWYELKHFSGSSIWVRKDTDVRLYSMTGWSRGPGRR